MKKGFLVVLLLILVGSCATVIEYYNDEWPVERYFRKAQEFSDKGKYQIALNYYDQVYARFPSRIEKVATAEYEQGFLYFKMKQYNKAKELFETVLDRTSDPAMARFFGSTEQWISYKAQDLLDKTHQHLNVAEQRRLAKEAKQKAKEERRLAKQLAKNPPST